MRVSASSRRRPDIAKLGCVFAVVLLLAVLLLGLHSKIAQADTEDYEYEFDDTSITELLADDFTESTDGDRYTYSEDDGMWESGVLDTTGHDSIWTTKRAFPTIPLDETYAVSGYFRNYSNNGMASFGFTTDPVNDLSETMYPVPATGLGIAFHGGSGAFVNDETVENSASWDGGDLTDRWYWMSLEVYADEDGTYDMHFTIYETDQDENTWDFKTEHTIEDIENDAFANADQVYAYFGTTGTRFDRLDSFEVEATKMPRETPPAPTSIRSYKDEGTGDVFLGGDFIELGISNLGSFGTHYDEDFPAGFFGTNERDNIGMSTNPAGFGNEPDLRMDYFMPGSEEERWAIGYKQGEDTITASNSLLGGDEDIEDNVVTDLSSGSTLKAQSLGTYNDTLQTKQTVSFERTNKFFRNEITLENTGAETIESVRYMRSFDPDNTVDQGGDYTTRNYIPFTHEEGDGKAVVVADTSWTDEDPVYEANGSRSPILFYSDDVRARVSTFGFGNKDPYEAEAYDEALPKDTSVDEDQAITIAFDVGNLAPGQSQTFAYYTSLDNRDFDEVLVDIAEDSAGFSTDKNGDNIPDDTQPHVAPIVSEVTGETVVLEVDEGCQVDTSLVKAEASHVVQDPGYDYPNGLLNFTVNCGDPGYTTTVKQYYFGVSLGSFAARKYNPDTKVYFNIPNASIGTTEVYGHAATTLTYSVTDGSNLDIDGTENGTIVDPAGLGTSSIGAPNTGLGGSQGFMLGRLTVRR